MGQYHVVVNLDKKEFIHPHKLGCGFKLCEQIATTGRALIILTACSNGRGGGDFDTRVEYKEEVIGRWAGDRIATVGDEAKPSDLAPEFRANLIFDQCLDGDGYEDISELVLAVIEHERVVSYYDADANADEDSPF